MSVQGDVVHQCIEETGFGKFQLLALALAAARTFTFASVTNLVSILQPFLRCQMQLTHLQATFIVLGESLTRMLSSVCVGKIADIFGRRKTLQLFLSMHVVTSILCALSTSLTMIIISRGAIGIFSPCRSLILAYAIEAVPVAKRKTLSLLRIFVLLGSLFGVFTGIVTLRYLNWRWYVIIAEGIPATVCLIVACFLPESPRFLNAKGRHEEAIKVLEGIAIMNGKSPTSVSRIYEACKDSSVEKKVVELSKLELCQRISAASFLLFTCGVVWMAISFGTMQFGENGQLISCGDCAMQLKYDYRFAMDISSGFSFIGGWVALANFERISAVRGLLFLTSLTLIPFYWDINQWNLIVTIVFSTFFIVAALSVVNVYEGELFPTIYRSFAIGICTSIHFFGMSVGTLLAIYAYHENRYICFGTMHALLFATFVAACFFPWKTKDTILKDR